MSKTVKATSISVIIPTYNCATYLPASIESVMSQTLQADEIIVIDDGSTDNTPDVVKNYAGKILYARQKHLGNAAARNHGIQLANGTWLCFLDADDLWEPHKLERQCEDLASDPHAKANFPRGRRFYDSGETEELRPDPVDVTQLWKALVYYQPFSSSLSGVMVHRECMLALDGFDEQLALSVDWDMWIRLAGRYPIRWFNDLLVHVRVHAHGANRDSELRLRMYRRCLEKHRALFCGQLGMKRDWRRSYGQRTMHLGRYLLQAGRWDESHAMLTQCLRYGGTSEWGTKLKLYTECQLRRHHMGPLVNMIQSRKHPVEARCAD